MIYVKGHTETETVEVVESLYTKDYLETHPLLSCIYNKSWSIYDSCLIRLKAFSKKEDMKLPSDEYVVLVWHASSSRDCNRIISNMGLSKPISYFIKDKHLIDFLYKLEETIEKINREVWNYVENLK